MSRLTPALNSRGRFVVSDPFNAQIKGTAIYRCVALRKFEDLVQLGENVYKKYYQAFGLSEAVYQNDVRNNVVIVSLQDAGGRIYYVPDSYVLTFPNQGETPYDHRIVSCSMGPLPAYVSTAFLEQQIAALVSDLIGIEPKVHVDTIPMLSSVTPEQHEVLETARLSRIENRQTDRARVIQLGLANQALQEQVNVMKQYLVDNELLG